MGLAPQLAGMVRHPNIDSPIFTHSFAVSRVGDTESDDESGKDGGSKAVSTSAVTVSVRTFSPFVLCDSQGLGHDDNQSEIPELPL